MQALIYTFSVLLGLVVGSFLNVVIYRMPRGLSLVRPGSQCPECKTPIRWYDNVPLLSWISLKGRCRKCDNPISVRYPLVEGFTGLSFGFAMWRFGLSWHVGLAWFFIAVLICLALIDLDHMIIPSRITLPGAAIGLAASIALQPDKWWVYLAAAAGGALFCFLLAVGWPGGGMGGGDVTMALFIGAVLGAPAIFVAFFLAFLTGTVFGLYIIATHKGSRKTRIPFGPFLSFGAYIALFAGESLIDGYMNLFR